MSQASDLHTAERWWATAEQDIRAARALVQAGFHAHACFAAQQAGEKAAKALWYALGEEPCGHSIQKLLSDLPRRDALPDLRIWAQRAAGLDRYYLPTRYPSGLPDLTPGEAYFQQDAEHAIGLAAGLLEATRRWGQDLRPAAETRG